MTYGFITGEQYRRGDGRYAIMRVTESRSPEPAMIVDTLAEAQEQVATFNTMQGLTAEQVESLTK